MVNKIKDGLLIFDDDSPLLVKRKKKKRKALLTKSNVSDDVLQFEKDKGNKRKRQTKKQINKNIPKYIIKNPSDCKHILPAFKKKLTEVWNMLYSENSRKADEVSAYLRGVASITKERRPKEYEEIKILIQQANKINTKRKSNEQIK